MIQLDNLDSTPSLKDILPKEENGGLWADDELCELSFADERSHTIHRIEAFLKDLDLSIYTREDIGNLVDEFNLASPFQLYLFLIDSDMTLFADGIGDKIEDFDELLEALREGLSAHMEYRLSEYMWMMHLPYITENISHKLMQGFSDINDFYDELNLAHNQVYLISDRLGLGKKDGIVIATKLYQILLEYEKELRECQELITLSSPNRICLQPYISENLDNYYSIADYISEITGRYGTKVRVRQVHRLHPEIEAFITDDKEKDIELIKALSSLNPNIKIFSAEEYLKEIAVKCIEE